ncbi:hypothetical protein NYE70_23755 [Paenibacillus sp. FSL R5-0407]|uniref:hypothetical protein n=1 Tax=Paenibacillus sp. FSL R5-0407 TaxID=2975320 RepID=UPI0030FC38C6
MSKSVEIKLESLADGSISERFNQELQKVLINIADPNTEAKTTRKINISLTIKPNENEKWRKYLSAPQVHWLRPERY